MTNFRNLKIAINAQHPLDEVVKTLESKGLKLTFKLTDSTEWVTINSGGYGFFNFNPVNFHESTTLAEIKEMK